MAGGFYLMIGAMLDPFGNSDTRVLVAGTALALSSFLLVFILWPRTKLALARRERPRRKKPKLNPVMLTAYGEAIRARTTAKQALVTRGDLPGPM
jgi:hypothetical protein